MNSVALIEPRGDTQTPSLWQPLDRHGGRPDALVTWDGATYRQSSWDDWHEASLRCAGRLRQLGVQAGDRVGCLLTNTPETPAAILGVWFAGGCAISLPLIARGMNPISYLAQLRTILARSEPTLLVCDAGTRSLLRHADLPVPVATFSELEGGPPSDPTPPAETAPAFVQFSSGSTSDPHGCVLTPRAIAQQLAALQEGVEIEEDRDTGVFWLPLSHDMGLFGGLLLSYWSGYRLVLSTPQRFLANPGSWFEDCARFRATHSAAPNFALDLATRVARRRLPPPFPMRCLVIGGERIEASTLREATAVLGDDRLRPAALVPAYGLAEAVLAVTMTPVGEGPKTLEVSADGLDAGIVDPEPPLGSQTVELVSAGRPLPRHDVSIASEAQVGELILQTPTLAEEYLNDAELTAERFTTRGFHTGDLGFFADHHLFVTGRVDDLIPMAGRNVYARDIELAIERLPDVRSGACAVVPVQQDGAPRLAALVELQREYQGLAGLAGRVRRVAQRQVGVALAECVFLARGQLPKTPSGKLQRYRCRELALDPPVGSVSV